MVTVMTWVVGIATVIALGVSGRITHLQNQREGRAEKAGTEAQARSISWWCLPAYGDWQGPDPIKFTPKLVESDLFDLGEVYATGRFVINNPSTSPVYNACIVTERSSEYVGVVAPGRVAYSMNYPDDEGSGSERFHADFESGSLISYLEFKDHRGVLWRLRPQGVLTLAPPDAKPCERPTS